jgi:CheY-like chemotaxis protein
MSPNETPAPRALVVEDEAVLLMLVAETLRDAGYVVHEAASGPAALDLLQTYPEMDLMITDIRMPGMSGYEVTNAAMALRPALKILLMTGYTEDAIPKNILDAGIRVLRKPFDMDQVPLLANKILESRAG